MHSRRASNLKCLFYLDFLLSTKLERREMATYCKIIANERGNVGRFGYLVVFSSHRWSERPRA